MKEIFLAKAKMQEINKKANTLLASQIKEDAIVLSYLQEKYTYLNLFNRDDKDVEKFLIIANVVRALDGVKRDLLQIK